jgi:hypothetical protein
VGVAAIAGMPTLFFEWDRFLVWQLLVIVFLQLTILIVALIAMRLIGYGIVGVAAAAHPVTDSETDRITQFAVRDLFLITSALALLCGVIHFTRPVELGGALYEILACGGICAAFVSLVALWASFSNRHIAIRAIGLLGAAPAGGVCYRIVAANYARLLMSAQFYAGVTTVQIVCMAVPLMVLRFHGFRLRRGNSRRADSQASITPPSPAAR